MKTRIFAMAALASVILLTGCGGSERNMEQHYTQDGYMGLSNSNPNLISNPDHHNYRKDRQLMRQALREMGLDKQSSIVFHGTQVTVTIYLQEDVSAREADAIQSDAYSLLKGHNPRYDYQIRIK